MLDYIIVGNGLAGVCFAKELLANKKTFAVVANTSQLSSMVAGALFNPVILKRFTPVWRAEQQLALMHETFSYFETFFNATYIEALPVLRKFASIEEQNMWFEASDKPLLSPYLNTKLVKNTYSAIDASLGFGEVLQTGRVAIKELLFDVKAYLLAQDAFLEETFDYDKLEIVEDGVVYAGLKAKHIVFAEGFGLHDNPFFNYLSLRGTKGQLLIIKAPDLQVDAVIKSAGFIIPLGNHLYKIGATYEHTDKTNEITEQGKEELLEKIKGLITCDYDVVDQLAGVRPTVADRRPLIGRHPLHSNLYVLNGLGTRGVMIGPYAAKQLYGFIEQGLAIDAEADSKRFEKRWLKANA